MKKIWIIAIVGLLIGYGFGSVLSPFKSSPEAGPDEEGRDLDFPDAVEVEVPVDNEKLAQLEQERDAALAELAELQTSLDNARAEIASYVAEVDELKTAKTERPQRSREDWQKRWNERQEKWKEENPEEYEAHQKRIKEFQEKMDGAVAEKSAFLVNLDTTQMTEEEKKDHDELLGRVAEAWELMNGMQEGKWPSREQWGEIGQNMTKIRELYGKERTYVLKQVGRDMGYGDEEAAEFSAHMQEVFEKTSPNLPMSSWRGFGRGRSSRGRSSSQESGGSGQQGGAEGQGAETK